jgi:hypothetical protein
MESAFPQEPMLCGLDETIIALKRNDEQLLNGTNLFDFLEWI